jgi:serine phosphatase RsbU (regulator of sigma subunit)/anti-sigma regulatory factor (Ser/Thr protein kinase)
MHNTGTIITRLRRSLQNRSNGQEIAADTRSSVEPPRLQTLDLEIAPNDPLAAYLVNEAGLVEVERLNLDSPALKKLKENGVKLIIPLVSQGELIGLLNLGPRRSEQDYSSDDHRLLNTLATQAAPALRVAQLVQQQQVEARRRERIEQELRVARVIQETLLPKDVPSVPGWRMAAYWQPARAVSGDFYDFINFPDGKLGIVEADVTDKGVPAALVMATSRTILRTVAEQYVSPGQVLEQANNLLCPTMPPNMFVTCLYALLDPVSGLLRFANAGHTIPYQRTPGGMLELRARGMPLGLMPEMTYEEKETTMALGDNVVIYSDGMVEAHNPQGEMFGFARLREMLNIPGCGDELVQCLLADLKDFTGPGWEQEDDVTFVTLERLLPSTVPYSLDVKEAKDEGWETIAEFSTPSQLGNETQVMEEVAASVQSLGLSEKRLERLKTAVAEAAMNAMEHGNHYQSDKPVLVVVDVSPSQLRVEITDYGGGQELPEPETPDLEAKLDGLQSPRGWGLFLIKNLVDEMHVHTDAIHHTLEIIFNLNGDPL